MDLSSVPVDSTLPSAVRAIISEALGADVPADGSFIAHGGDSFHAVLVVARIEELWGLEVDFLDVLRSTPDELAGRIAELATNQVNG